MKFKINWNAGVAKAYAAVFAVYLLISLAMFWNITANITTSIVSGGGDAFQNLWNLWWVPYSIFTLYQSPYHTSMILYPIGADLASQTMEPLAGILSAPLQAVSIPFAYNFLFFTSFALSGIFMFMLAERITSNRYASFIAGLVYAFSPMHIAQGYSHLQWTLIEFIPLFVLFFILMLREDRKAYAVLAGFGFVLLTFFGDIEQGIMAVFFALVTVLLFLVWERRGFLKKSLFINAGVFAVSVAVIGSPFLIWIVPNITSSALHGANQLSGVANNMLYSDNLLSFFLPSYYNGVFTSIAKGYYNQLYGLTYQGNQYEPDISEKVSYIGYTVLALAVFGVYYEMKNEKRLRTTGYWLVILAVFVLLSLGPYVQIYTYVSAVPTLYSVYRNIPIFNIIREPGRFDVFVTISLAVLAAYGFSAMTKEFDKRKAFYCAVAVSALILLEYNGMPLTGSFASTLMTNAGIPKAYPQLGRLQGNFSVLMLPALANPLNGYMLYPGISMYYQTAMKKPIVGGYTTRMNSTQQLYLSMIPLIVSSSYLEGGQGLVFPYPIRENYSNLTDFWLATYNVGFVSVIRGAYTPQEQQLLLTYLNSIFGNPVYQDANTTVFSTEGALSTVGRSTVAYTIGTWLPGYYLCQGPYSTCNQTVSSMWWGNNTRGIMVYSPKQQNITIRMNAMTAYPGLVLQTYMIYGQHEEALRQITLTGAQGSYALNVSLQPGFNEIGMYAPNATTENAYLEYGMDNITFGA